MYSPNADEIVLRGSCHIFDKSTNDPICQNLVENLSNYGFENAHIHKIMSPGQMYATLRGIQCSRSETLLYIFTSRCLECFSTKGIKQVFNDIAKLHDECCLRMIIAELPESDVEYPPCLGLFANSPTILFNGIQPFLEQFLNVFENFNSKVTIEYLQDRLSTPYWFRDSPTAKCFSGGSLGKNYVFERQIE